MKILTFSDVASLKPSVSEYMRWVEDILTHKHEAILPPKISMKISQKIFCNVMPCVIPEDISPLGFPVGGAKIVTRYPQRVPSLDSMILIFNAQTGEFLALMDGNIITAMRTGAVAAHSVRLFARSNWQTLGIMGLGNTARASLLMLAESDRRLKVKLLKYKGQEELFMKRFESYGNISFECVNSPEELVKGSDVVISAVTYADRDFCDDSCFDEGVLVVPVHTLGFTNCDLFFDKVFADDTGHVKHFRNFDRFRYFAEVSDVMAGKAQGRMNDTERILAYNIGLSIHDINFAAHIFKSSSKIHTAEFSMNVPESKFWL